MTCVSVKHAYLMHKLGVCQACMPQAQVVPSAGSGYNYVSLYAKYGQPPGWAYGQSDFHTSGGYSPWDQGEAAYELKFDATEEGFQTGVPQAGAVHHDAVHENL